TACLWLQDRGAMSPDAVSDVPRLRTELVAAARRQIELEWGNLDARVETSTEVSDAADAFLPKMELVVGLAEASANEVVDRGNQRAAVAALLAAVVLTGLSVVSGRLAVRRLRDGQNAQAAANQLAHNWAVSEQSARRHVEAVKSSLEQALARKEEAEHAAAAKEQQRQAMELRYELAVTGTSDGIWDWDMVTGRVWFSEACSRQLGYEDAPLEPSLKTFTDQLCHPDDVDRVMGAVEAHLQNGTPFEEIVRLQHRDGSWRRIRTRGSAALDRDGKPIRFAGAHQDLTDLLDREERLRHMAENASAAKSRLIADVSHEIRTPMAAILSYADGITQQCADAAKLNDVAAAIARNGQHLLGLLDDVLDDAAIEAGELGISKSAVQVREICDDVRSAFSGRAESKGVTLDIRVSEAVPSAITTDPTRLRQILFNLVSNAVKFTDDGNVGLDVHWENERLLASVTDTGKGIDEKHLAGLFQRFEQADDGTGSTASQFGGSGLGLSISKRLAQLLGGDIDVTSTLGEGSCFAVHIDSPVCEAVVETGNDPLEEERVDVSGRRVLVVEDHPELRALLKGTLERAGCHVETAEDGQAAVEAVIETTEAFDVVILDYHLPHLSGVEVASKLREVMGPRAPGLILCSAAADRVSDDCTTSELFEARLAKPAKRVDLIRAIAACPTSRGDMKRVVVASVDEDEDDGFEELKQAFLARCVDQKAQLLRGLESASHEDLTQARSAAHQMRSAGSFGYPELAPFATSAEAALDARLDSQPADMSPVRSLVEAIDRMAEPRRRAA
ncbi:MAG: ATP-binding protein, partial [Planctomycetota bacterium]